MSAIKPATRWGVLLKDEASYGAGATVAAADDGHLVHEEPKPDPDYMDKGERKPAAGTLGEIANVAPSGLFYGTSLLMEPAGGGAAYSATVLPNIHRLLIGGGMVSALDATPGTESYTYTPESSGFDSLGGEIYIRGQKYVLTHGYIGDWSISAEGPSIPVYEGALSALGGVPTDVALPSITYPYGAAAYRVPPKAVNMTLTINSVATHVMRSFTLAVARELSPRADQSVSAVGHAGWTPGRIKVTFDCVVEALALATTDPYTLWNAATPMVIQCDWGTVQYSKFEINAPIAQLVDVDDPEDGATGLWGLSFELKDSSPVANDSFTIIAD